MNAAGVRRGRTRFFALILALWGAVVVARLVQIQIAQGSRYRAKAQRQQERRVEIPGAAGLDPRPRGPRARGLGRDDVRLRDPRRRARSPPRPPRFSRPALGMPAEEILEKLSSDQGFVWLRRQLDPETAEAVQALKLPGIHFVAEPKRFYPKGRLAGAVLGFVGTDGVGLAGPRALLRRGDPRKARRARRPDRRAAQPLRRGRRRRQPSRRGGRLARPLARLGACSSPPSTSSPRRCTPTGAKSGSIVVMDPSERRDPRDGLGPRLRPERVQPLPRRGPAEPGHRRRVRAGLDVQDRHRGARARARARPPRRDHRHRRRHDPRRRTPRSRRPTAIATGR